MRIVALAALAMLLTLPSGLTWADGQKLGFVDINQVVQSIPTAKKASEAFNRSLDAKQQALDAQRDKIEQAQRDMEKQAALMSEEQKRNKERQIQSLVSSLQKSQMEAQNALEQEKNELDQALLSVQDEIFQAVEKIGKDQGFAFIFHDKATAYVDPSVDITEQVITALAKPVQDGAEKSKK